MSVAPDLTWDMRVEALQSSLDQCWFPEALAALLADHRTKKIRFAAKARGRAEWDRIETAIETTMDRCGLELAVIIRTGSSPP